MPKCLDCGSDFDEPDILDEDSLRDHAVIGGFDPDRYAERYSDRIGSPVCPDCGSSSIESEGW